MACFSRDKSGLYRFKVPHFAHEDHVWVLSQAAAKGLGKRTGVHIHLSLCDERLLVLMEKLDRVLDGYDVAVSLLVNMVDHRRQRGRFTGTRRTGHEDESAHFLGNGV